MTSGPAGPARLSADSGRVGGVRASVRLGVGSGLLGYNWHPKTGRPRLMLTWRRRAAPRTRKKTPAKPGSMTETPWHALTAQSG